MMYKLCLSDVVQVRLTKLGYEVLDNYLENDSDYINEVITLHHKQMKMGYTVLNFGF